MPVEHVEIHKVRKNEASALVSEYHPQLPHAIRVVLGRDVALDAPAVVDVVNLADAEDWHLVLYQHIQQHGTRRLDRIIVAALGAPEISWRAGEGTRDDPADFVRSVEQFARDLAHAVKLRDGDHVFVRRNLEYAVARSVNNREPRAHMLLAQFFDDLGAGGGLVADRFAANLALEPLDQLARETLFVDRKRLGQPNARHFPMPGGCVLPRRMRCTLAVASFRPVSPYSAASGSSPIPTLSKTIQMIRSNAAIARLDGKYTAWH